MNKIDRFLEFLIEDIEPKQLWKLIFNKMTNQAKRQMLSEILNSELCGISTINCKMFKNNNDNNNQSTSNEIS